jgi:ABC-type molybdate transport system substrate-binding protein
VIVRALARVLLATALVVSSAAARADEPLRLFAAGSLRGAMTEIARSYTAAAGAAVTPTFGSSGLLRERIEREGGADVFASADTGHPDTLAAAGRAAPPVVFARNRLCALVAPGVEVTRETLLERMLDPAVKLGTSTPKADPSGDYAWQVFELAEKIRPGAFATLDRKALKLTGGPSLPTTTPDRSVYGVMLAERKADIFLAYCTAGLDVVREVPGSRVMQLPESLAVGASYSLTVVNGARPGANRLALYILSRPAQEILAKYGFTPVALP